MEFSNDMTMFTVDAGQRVFEQRILTYGYPTPSFTLNKKEGNSYVSITGDSRVTLNTELIRITNADHSDSGKYQLVATNMHGSYLFNFTLNASGMYIINNIHAMNVHSRYYNPL